MSAEVLELERCGLNSMLVGMAEKILVLCIISTFGGLGDFYLSDTLHKFEVSAFPCDGLDRMYYKYLE